jgi:hypothetical protein
MQQYIVQHAHAIYRHAKNWLGENESLYVITGCVKSESWAIAAYNRQMDRGHNILRLAPGTNADSEHQWTAQGSACSAHSGRSDQQGVRDQSLFLQGFKIALSARLRSQVEGPDMGDHGPSQSDPENGGGDSHHPPGPPERGSESDSNLDRDTQGGANSGWYIGEPRHPRKNCSSGTSLVPGISDMPTFYPLMLTDHQ